MWLQVDVTTSDHPMSALDQTGSTSVGEVVLNGDTFCCHSSRVQCLGRRWGRLSLRVVIRVSCPVTVQMLTFSSIAETRGGGGLYGDDIVGAAVCVADGNCLYRPHSPKESSVLTLASSSAQVLLTWPTAWVLTNCVHSIYIWVLFIVLIFLITFWLSHFVRVCISLPE